MQTARVAIAGASLWVTSQRAVVGFECSGTQAFEPQTKRPARGSLQPPKRPSSHNEGGSRLTHRPARTRDDDFDMRNHFLRSVYPPYQWEQPPYTGRASTPGGSN